MDGLGALLLALFVLAYALVSRRLSQSIITPPIVFALFGYCLSGLVLDGDGHARLEAMHVIMELTLVLVLFTDASRIEFRRSGRASGLPLRLLLVGLPLTIALGAFAAKAVFPTLSLASAVILAIILAPTDAALGMAVVSNPLVPEWLRKTLNIESGLNDGLAVPLLSIALFYAAQPALESTLGAWLWFVIRQIVVAVATGAAVGYIGAKLLEFGAARDWIEHSYLHFACLALAILAFTSAEMFHSSGFVAAFIAGLALGNTSRRLSERFTEFAELEGQLLILLTFAIFGIQMIPWTIERLNWESGLYALLSLTLVRMLPVWVSLVGAGVNQTARGFIGWFGPRGVASIIFLLVVVQDGNLAEADRVIVFTASAGTVLASIFLHGLTAMPAVRKFGPRMSMQAVAEGIK